MGVDRRLDKHVEKRMNGTCRHAKDMRNID